MNDIISLIGMTGAGKTTVGTALAEMLEYRMIDIDAEITDRCGQTPRIIFDKDGELHFRKIELTVLSDVIDKYGNSGLVLSCGGGIVTYSSSADLLCSKTKVVWVKRDPNEIIKCREVMARPPINGDPKRYFDILTRREPVYRSCADIEVENNGAKETALEIINILNQFEK